MARRALVAAQVGLSLVLISGAGLFIRSLAMLSRQDIGIDSRRTLFVWTAPGQTGRDSKGLALFAQQAIDRLSAIPGVISAGASNHGPLEGGDESGASSALLRVQGQAPKPGMLSWRIIISPRFFESVEPRFWPAGTLGPMIVNLPHPSRSLD